MLTEAQAQLHEHFLSLSRDRTRVGYPVYALEHGLSSSEIDGLRTELSQTLIHQGGLSAAHTLPWLIVATEIGYVYDGDEFWDSFADAMPCWRAFGNRTTIRSWFANFAQRYQGFRPTGRWAEHFSIIAWPITHAILPRDLQALFAQHLYDLRYELARRPGASIAELGSIVEAGDRFGSSRFQNFLAQNELTARLVLALRDEDVQDRVPAIYPPTLARIVADLEKRQSARYWLREARNVLREARLRASTTLAPRSGPSSERREPEQDSSGSVRLIAKQSSDGPWAIGVKLPDLTQIIERAGIAPKRLDQTRVRLIDRPDHWMPGRALLALSGTEQRILSLGTLTSGPVLNLERDVESVSALLDGVLRIRGQSPWLLRIQDDGVARQVLGNHVRTGQTYLLLSNTPLPPANVTALQLQSVESDVLGLTLYLFAVPRVLQAQQIQALAAIQLGYALRANIEPIGLVPRWESVVGRTVWLTTEEPLLRLSADHPIQEFIVTVDGRSATRIPIATLPEVIISLGHLPIGSHIIEVATVATGLAGSRFETEHFEFMVRAPIPWQQGVRRTAGFRPIVEPADASLETVFSGKARVAVIGPADRRLAVDARLFNLNGHMTDTIPLGTVASLADELAIRKCVMKLGKEPLTERVQAAPRVDLAFRVDELGTDSLSFSHKVRALRWRLTIEGHDYRARLIDDTGGDHPVTIDRYDIAQPDRRTQASYDDCVAGVTIEPPGCLLAATCDEERYTAILSVPPRQSLDSLRAIGLSIVISPTINAPNHMPRLLALLRLWKKTDQTLGKLGQLRKTEVCRAFEQTIAVIVCGQSWAGRARQCHSVQDPLLEQLRREIDGAHGFTARLRANDWRYAAHDPAARAEFIRLANVYKVSDVPQLCTLALLAAFAPETIRFKTPDKGVSYWSQLAQTPTLARGAFFARILTDLDSYGQASAEIASA